MTFMLAHSIQGVPHKQPLTVLLDSGSTSSWFNRTSLPSHITSTTVDALTGTTMAGEFSSNQQVTLSHIILPELSRNVSLSDLQARVFNADCRYDLILGRDVLRHFRISLDFNSHIISTLHNAIHMREFPSLQADTDRSDLAQQLLLDHMDSHLVDDNSPLCNDDPDDYIPMSASDQEPELSLNPEDVMSTDTKPEITAAKYGATDANQIVRTMCTHLSLDRQNQLCDVLSKYDRLFDGELKSYPLEQIHLDVDSSVSPYRSRAYPIAQSQLKLFKDELDRLCKIGVLEEQGRSTWIAGTFIIPKKDNTIRWISDFRALNKALKRKVYPIPRIQDILSRRKGYEFLTKLDISMQYYTFELDDESKDLCTIATPFGLYRYRRLPMGISQSPDIAQEIMERVLRAIDDIEVYIDDIACFSNTFDAHMELIDTVLDRLQSHGFSINPLKCEWAVQETDFLGHWLTPSGIKPLSKKVDAILHMQPPTNPKELRSFLGLVTYYRDMWPRRSHILSPLTDLLKKPKHSKFEWLPIHQKSFDEMKSLIASDTLLCYPDHNLPFDIETDASDYQLGAVIKQNNRPVAYYTRKLNDAQRNYTTIEKELLSVVETFREFRTMLLGAKISVYTDHRNLTHKLSQFTTQRVMRWRLLLEEYNPTFHYIPGPKNVVADAISRVPTSLAAFLSHCPTSAPIRPDPKPRNYTESHCLWHTDPLLTECLMAVPTRSAQPSRPTSGQTSGPHYPDPVDPLQHDMFLFHPRFDARGNLPFHFATIHTYQQQDPHLTSVLDKDPRRFFKMTLGGYSIICFYDKPDDDSSWSIVLPDQMLKPLIDWYHKITVHSTGMDRLEALIRRNFWHPRIRENVREIISNCQICPQVRLAAKPYGELAPRDAPIAPWSEVHVDFIGPWNIKINDITLEFNALTCIDPVTNLIEINRLTKSKTADNAKELFENNWLARYPRPLRLVHDHGPEFHGHDFQFPLDYAGIKAVNISPNTPTANSVIESCHRTIGQIIRTMVNLTPPTSSTEADSLVDSAIAQAMFALRCSPNSSLGNYSPGALVFNRDMLLDIPVIADILTLTQNRQALIDRRLLQANKRRIRHEYKVGQQVFVKIHDRKSKLSLVRTGPFPIVQVHTNNTVTIRRGPILERISIRHLLPFKPVGTALEG